MLITQCHRTYPSEENGRIPVSGKMNGPGQPINKLAPNTLAFFFVFYLLLCTYTHEPFHFISLSSVLECSLFFLPFSASPGDDSEFYQAFIPTVHSMEGIDVLSPLHLFPLL